MEERTIEKMLKDKAIELCRYVNESDLTSDEYDRVIEFIFALFLNIN